MFCLRSLFASTGLSPFQIDFKSYLNPWFICRPRKERIKANQCSSGVFCHFSLAFLKHLEICKYDRAKFNQFPGITSDGFSVEHEVVAPFAPSCVMQSVSETGFANSTMQGCKVSLSSYFPSSQDEPQAFHFTVISLALLCEPIMQPSTQNQYEIISHQLQKNCKDIYKHL